MTFIPISSLLISPKMTQINAGRTLLLVLISLFTCTLLVAQDPEPCPPVDMKRTTNPEFPGCLSPADVKFRILLVLDESYSIASAGQEGTVEGAVNNFASTLRSNFPTAGKMEMGIVDFSDNAFEGVAMTDVASGGFLGLVSSYLTADGTGNPNYNPDAGNNTDFEAALLKIASYRDIDIVFFFTDGIPTDGNTTRSRLIRLANDLKCAGTYMFAIGVGSGANEERIQDLSYEDKLGDSGSENLINGADYTMESFTSFGQLLTDLANSLIDKDAPQIACPAPIKMSNKPGECGNNVNFNPTVSDNCPNVNVSCTPASGSFFPVGVTSVTCTARDNVNLTTTCNFSVTILDMEAPNIICPANKTISCEESLDPSNLGNPTALDNCGVGPITHKDLRIDGSCPGNFTIERTWTAADIHGNIRTCLQTVKAEDKKSPVVTCPANITVECDTSVAKTGVATATDNCDTRVDFTRFDTHISGDCEWFCITDRTWTGKDDCGNTAKCIQRITKDVTPLIEKALEAGPLQFGQNAATVTITAGHGNCVVKWLPYSGTTPKSLPFDDAVAGAACTLMSNPIDAAGRLENPLLGETMKLSILVRLNPALGTRKLSTFPCTLPFIVRQQLKPNPDVNELIRVTNLTLGNVIVALSQPPHINQLLDYLKCINGKFTVCKPN